MSVLTTATRRSITEDGALPSVLMLRINLTLTFCPCVEPTERCSKDGKMTPEAGAHLTA
jgi:hypothetical protein